MFFSLAPKEILIFVYVFKNATQYLRVRKINLILLMKPDNEIFYRYGYFDITITIIIRVSHV
jgi:hypothetical protein